MQAQPNDPVEVARRERANGRLCASGDSALAIEQSKLDDAILIAKWHRIGEIEIATRLDKGEVHASGLRVRNHPLDPRHGKVAPCLVDLAWLVVDDPVTDTSFDTCQVLGRKLISFSGAVVVDRIRTMDEDAEAHV